MRCAAAFVWLRPRVWQHIFGSKSVDVFVTCGFMGKGERGRGGLGIGGSSGRSHTPMRICCCKKREGGGGGATEGPLGRGGEREARLGAGGSCLLLAQCPRMTALQLMPAGSAGADHIPQTRVCLAHKEPGANIHAHVHVRALPPLPLSPIPPRPLPGHPPPRPFPARAGLQSCSWARCCCGRGPTRRTGCAC